jgi:hypothetical protein
MLMLTCRLDVSMDYGSCVTVSDALQYHLIQHFQMTPWQQLLRVVDDLAQIGHHVLHHQTQVDLVRKDIEQADNVLALR